LVAYSDCPLKPRLLDVLNALHTLSVSHAVVLIDTKQFGLIVSCV
jgi:hypothetical protein